MAHALARRVRVRRLGQNLSLPGREGDVRKRRPAIRLAVQTVFVFRVVRKDGVVLEAQFGVRQIHQRLHRVLHGLHQLVDVFPAEGLAAVEDDVVAQADQTRQTLVQVGRCGRQQG